MNVLFTGIQLLPLPGLCIHIHFHILCLLTIMTVYVHCKFFWCMVYKETQWNMLLTYSIAFKIPWAVNHHAILRMNLQHSESSALPGYSCLLNWKFTTSW